MKLIYLLVSIATLVGVSPWRAEAAAIEGVRFEDRLEVDGIRLHLHGTALLRYRVFIKGYVVALYLDESFEGPANPQGVLADTARRLEIEYFWSIGAKDFASATIEGIARNTDSAGFERIRPSIEQLNALYEDVEPGDRYALTYVPGIGTELARNGQRLGVIEGAEFSAALFSIWLGDRPLDESLRNQLLAQN